MDLTRTTPGCIGEGTSPELTVRILIVESIPPRILDAKGVALLTKQEQGIARLVAEGLTNRDIGRQMNLSENTVRNYMFRIFDKLGTSNRVELALYAVQRKM